MLGTPIKNIDIGLPDNPTVGGGLRGIVNGMGNTGLPGGDSSLGMGYQGDMAWPSGGGITGGAGGGTGGVSGALGGSMGGGMGQLGGIGGEPAPTPAIFSPPSTTPSIPVSGGGGGGPYAPTGISGMPVPGSPEPAVLGPPGFPAMPTGPMSSGTPGSSTPPDLSAGVDTSMTSLLPQGFNIGQLTAPAVPDATTPGAASYTNAASTDLQGPTMWNVTPEQTVAGQYANLMSAGNPAIKAAEEASIRAHAAAGGRNSTMAQGAATLAGSTVALAIAQQDAQTQAAAGQYNANAANQFADNLNKFVENATLSQQNFEQGVAMLKDQTIQANAQLYAQVQASAGAASINIKTALQNTQIALNSTFATMDKQFAQSNDQAWTNFGMQVRMGYLAALNTQQNALMQTIGNIRNNPNITTTQAGYAIKQAVDEFNSFVTMNNAYYASMVPGSAAATSGQYNAASFPYG